MMGREAKMRKVEIGWENKSLGRSERESDYGGVRGDEDGGRR